MGFKSPVSPYVEALSNLLRQPDLTTSEVISILQRRPDPPLISEEEAFFSDFDETVARLKSFDLEAGIEPEEIELSSLPTIGNDKHDVK